MKFSWQMQHEYAFVGVCLEEKNTKKEMIDKKINVTIDASSGMHGHGQRV